MKQNTQSTNLLAVFEWEDLSTLAVMPELSIVIIAKNEVENLRRLLPELRTVSSDILVIDSGSTDGTADLVKNLKIGLVETAWLGYGPTKNFGNHEAKNDWILSLDADEIPDKRMISELIKITESKHELSADTIFLLKRNLFYCKRKLNFGGVGDEWRSRIFNRRHAFWDDKLVHEELNALGPSSYKKLPGNLRHYSFGSRLEHRTKMDRYAQFSAREMYQKNKKANFLKLYLNPTFQFLKNYIIKLGFLDGVAGLAFAYENARYVYLKYNYLKNLDKN